MATPRLHVETEGDGPAVVLMHGFGGSARNFGPQARALRPRHRVVRFDARGHARSEAPDDPAAYEPAEFVGDVARVLDQAGTDRAVVGGLSMGAGVALRFALAHPERTAALVLAAFPSGADGRGIGSIAPALADAIERDGIEAAGERYLWGPSERLDPKSAALIRRGFLEHAPHALVHTLRKLIARQPAVRDIADDIAKLHVPALVVVGSEDRSSLESSREIAAALPNATLVVVEGAGHVVNLANPSAFNAALLDFDPLRS